MADCQQQDPSNLSGDRSLRHSQHAMSGSYDCVLPVVRHSDGWKPICRARPKSGPSHGKKRVISVELRTVEHGLTLQWQGSSFVNFLIKFDQRQRTSKPQATGHRRDRYVGVRLLGTRSDGLDAYLSVHSYTGANAATMTTIRAWRAVMDYPQTTMTIETPILPLAARGCKATAHAGARRATRGRGRMSKRQWGQEGAESASPRHRRVQCLLGYLSLPPARLQFAASSPVRRSFPTPRPVARSPSD